MIICFTSSVIVVDFREHAVPDQWPLSSSSSLKVSEHIWIDPESETKKQGGLRQKWQDFGKYFDFTGAFLLLRFLVNRL
jgi:hypothetical protein